MTQIGEPKYNGRETDWTGVQINEWKVLSHIKSTDTNNTSNLKYDCECVYCHRHCCATIFDLKTKIRHSNCLNEDERIGKVFGTFQIIDYAYHTSKNKLYKCKCIKCGEERITSYHNILKNTHQCYNIQHIGETIDVCTIVGAKPKEKYEDVVYIAKCNICGHIKYSTYNHLKRDCKDFCNHITKFNKQIVHGGYWSNKRIRDIFYGMLTRCYDEEQTGKQWKNYGGKGITVCEEWRNNPKLFEEWSLKHGYTDTLTIDRIDANKGYSPENCRWITGAENTSRAASFYITVNDLTLNLQEWDEYLHLGKQHICRYKNKYGVQETIRHIEAILEYGYDEQTDHAISFIVNNEQHNMSQWSKLLGYKSNAVGKIYRKYGREAAIQFIQDKLNEQNKQL